MSDVAAFSLSCIALAVGAVFSALAARRAAYERVMSALDFISDGSVARARHRIGALVYDCQDQLAAGEAIDFPIPEERSARIEDLFTVLWAARRIEATRRSLGSERVNRGPHRLLEQSVRGWVVWWVQEPEGADGFMRIEQLGRCLDATLDRSDDLDGLLTLRDAWGSSRSAAGL